MKNIKKFIIGTANFIPKYGINNNKNFNLDKNNQLMIECYNRGLNHFDLSPSYGLAEKSFGKIFFKKKILLDTKLSLIKKNIKNIKKIQLLDEIFHISLDSLNVSRINILYVHSLDDFFKYKKHYLKFLKKLKKEKKINKIGFSIYNLNDLKKIIKLIIPDVIQVPYNVFNQDFDNIYVNNLRKKHNIKFYARSIFLKGLLLNKNVNNLKSKFVKKNSYLFKKYYDFLKKQKVNKLEACLFFALKSNFEKIIIGLDNINHLNSLMKVLNLKRIPNINFSNLKSNKTNMIDLRKWK